MWTEIGLRFFTINRPYKNATPLTRQFNNSFAFLCVRRNTILHCICYSAPINVWDFCAHRKKKQRWLSTRWMLVIDARFFSTIPMLRNIMMNEKSRILESNSRAVPWGWVSSWVALLWTAFAADAKALNTDGHEFYLSKLMLPVD